MAIDEREIRVNQISLIASFGLWWKNTRSRGWDIAGGFLCSDYDRGDENGDDDRGDTDNDSNDKLEC